MNKVIMTVTLCADPEVKTYGSDGKVLVSFNGAVNKRFKKEGEADADFFKYTAFGKTAEFIAKYFKKGSKMLITGEVNNNNYEKDGVKHYGTQILIDNVEFFGKKSDNEVSDNTSSNAPANKAPVNDYAPSDDPFGNTSANSSAAVSSYDEYDDF